MPFYTIATPPGVTTKAQRDEMAESIVEMHLRLAGGLRQFVNVMFHEYDPTRFYVGGRHETRVMLDASIRAGRTKEVKTALLTSYSALASRVLGVPEADLLVSVNEIRAENVMEGGHILPEPGDEEEWLRKVMGAAVAAE